MDPNILNYGRPDPRRPRWGNRLMIIGIGVWLVGWAMNVIGTARYHGRPGAAVTASGLGFDLVLLAFAITLVSGMVGPRRAVPLAIALVEIATCCVTLRH